MLLQTVAVVMAEVLVAQEALASAHLEPWQLDGVRWSSLVVKEHGVMVLCSV